MSEPKKFFKLEVDDQFEMFLYKCELENNDPKQVLKEMALIYLHKYKKGKITFNKEVSDYLQDLNW